MRVLFTIKLLSLLIVSLPLAVHGQNLIPNSSFEDKNFCETKIPCSPSAWYSVSNIPYGFQNNLWKPMSGKQALGFLIAFEKNIRSYWQTMLLCNLQAGKQYVVTFNIYSLNAKFHPSYFGIYLSDTLFQSVDDTIFTKTEYLSIRPENVKSLKNNWKEVVLLYTATGKEKFVLLGNFSTESNEEILVRTGGRRYLEYYVDNIEMRPKDKMSGKFDGLTKRRDSLYTANHRHTPVKKNERKNYFTDIALKSLLPKADTLVLDPVHFGFDSDQLLSTTMLDLYFDSLEVSKIDRIEIHGYTDSIGSESYNLKLSERRALYVKQYLENRYGFKDNIISSSGKGMIKDSKPLERNRRVELIIVQK